MVMASAESQNRTLPCGSSGTQECRSDEADRRWTHQYGLSEISPSGVMLPSNCLVQFPGTKKGLRPT